MPLWAKNKVFKFQVELTLEELTSVPFINAVLFAKIKLQNGGNFREVSSREEVKDHYVRWNKTFRFNCRLTANASSGVLRPCICRISIRKETNGGKSYAKLGYVNIDLAEFAGGGAVDRKYLLEGYSGRQGRQDNSTLRVLMNVVLQSGDPCFKRPVPSSRGLESRYDSAGSGDSGSSLDKRTPRQGSSDSSDDEDEGTGLTATTGRPTSPPTIHKKRSPAVPRVPVTDIGHGHLELEACLTAADLAASASGQDAAVLRAADPAAVGDFELGHARNSSAASRVSGYASMSGAGATHSRQSSSGDSAVAASSHMRNPSSSSGHGSGHSNASSFERAAANNQRKRKKDSSATCSSLDEAVSGTLAAVSSAVGSGATGTVPVSISGPAPVVVTPGGVSLAARVGNTRIDPQDVIEDLLQGTQIKCSEPVESQGLQLFVHADNSTSLGSSKGLPGKASHSPVVISPTANSDR